MANNRFNKQVTPKGYMMGGRAKKMGGGMMMERPMMKEGGKSSSVKTTVKPKNQNRDLENIRIDTRKGLLRPKRAEKMGGGMMMMERPMMKKGGPSKKPKVKKIAIGTGKAKDYPGIKKIIEMNKQGRKRFKAGGSIDDKLRKLGKEIKANPLPNKTKELLKQLKKSYSSGSRKKFKMGGALKPVDPQTQKGLSKLPTKVRNKMGYMQDGGKVKKAGLFKLDKNTLLQFKDLMTGSSDSPSGKLKKFVKDMEKKNKKEKKSNGK